MAEVFIPGLDCQTVPEDYRCRIGHSVAGYWCILFVVSVFFASVKRSRTLLHVFAVAARFDVMSMYQQQAGKCMHVAWDVTSYFEFA